jgi:butyrate kinase
MSDDLGIWFVLFRKDRLPAMKDILARVSRAPRFEVRPIDDSTFVIAHQGAEVTVGLSTASHVADESAEIADRIDAENTAHDVAAQADARFEIVWDLDDRKEAFDAFVHVGGILEKMTGGVLWDPRRLELV